MNFGIMVLIWYDDAIQRHINFLSQLTIEVFIRGYKIPVNIMVAANKNKISK